MTNGLYFLTGEPYFLKLVVLLVFPEVLCMKAAFPYGGEEGGR